MTLKALKRWPVVRQIMNLSDGTGQEVMSDKTKKLKVKTLGTQVARSICPYCGVGCGQLALGIADLARPTLSQGLRKF